MVFLQAPTELIIEYVRDLRKDSRQYVGNVEVSKILVISHDISFGFECIVKEIDVTWCVDLILQ